MDYLAQPGRQIKQMFAKIALRRRTHAALLTKLPGYYSDPPIELLDDELFGQRLRELGYPSDPEFSFELLDDTGVIRTLDSSAGDIKYRSAREKVWCNFIYSQQ